MLRSLRSGRCGTGNGRSGLVALSAERSLSGGWVSPIGEGSRVTAPSNVMCSFSRPATELWTLTARYMLITRWS